MAVAGAPCSASASAEPVRRRDAITAWIAGAGAGGLVSARGGDAVRVLLLRRRLPEAGCPVLAGTLVAEGAGELAIGVALSRSPLPQASRRCPACPTPSGSSPPSSASVLVAAFARSRACARVARGVGRGCSALRSPGAYARGVLPWQLASRVCRLGALACFLAAFGLPATPAAVLLVLGAQTGGRLLPFAPAAVGAGAAMLAAGFEPVTGAAIPAGQVAAFFIGTSAVLTMVGSALALAICLRAVGWRQLLATVRPTRRAPATLEPVG